MIELVSTLNRRKKWQSVWRNVKVGKIVLLTKADVPRRQWSLGYVLEVVEGDDGFVRVVKVQVGGSVVTSSVTKICPLEVGEDNQNITKVRQGRGE